MTRHVIICGPSAALEPQQVAPLLPERVTIYATDKTAAARKRVQALAAVMEAALGCTIEMGEGRTPTLDDLRDAYALVTDLDSLAQAARTAYPLMHVVPTGSNEPKASTLLLISTDAVFRPPIDDPDIVEQWTLENKEVAHNTRASGKFALGDWDIRLARMHGVVGASWAVAFGTDTSSAAEVASRLPHTSEHGTTRCGRWEADDVANDLRYTLDLILERGVTFERIQIVMGPQAPGFIEQMMDRMSWLVDVPVSCRVTSRLGIEERDIQAFVPLSELTVSEPWTPAEWDGPL